MSPANRGREPRGQRGPPHRVVACPDSLKEVLSAGAAAAALVRGVKRVQGWDAEAIPLADGGEGTAEAIAARLGGTWHEARVRNPVGQIVPARLLELRDGRVVVESAEAVGLGRVSPTERNLLVLSSEGVGDLILSALELSCREIIVGLGGTATVDGGKGLLDALEQRDLHGVRLVAACDVQIPLLGPRGAARLFGPQKGASPDDVIELERRLAAMTALRPFADLPGAGAAGGIGAALASLGAKLVSGPALVLDLVDLRRCLRGAALAITGEGTVDETTIEGKLPSEVVRACARADVPSVIFGGRVRASRRTLYELGAAAVFELSGDRTRAESDLEGLGEAVASLLAGTQSLRSRSPSRSGAS